MDRPHPITSAKPSQTLVPQSIDQTITKKRKSGSRSRSRSVSLRQRKMPPFPTPPNMCPHPKLKMVSKSVAIQEKLASKAAYIQEKIKAAEEQKVVLEEATKELKAALAEVTARKERYSAAAIPIPMAATKPKH